MITKEQLKQARLTAGLSQSDAAKLVGIKTQTTWSRWETGAKPVNQALAELFLLKLKRLR